MEKFKILRVFAPQLCRQTIIVLPPVGQGFSAMAQWHFGWGVPQWGTASWGAYQHPWPLPTRWQSHSFPSCDNQKCLQTWPNVPCAAKSPPLQTESHCYKKPSLRSLLQTWKRGWTPGEGGWVKELWQDKYFAFTVFWCLFYFVFVCDHISGWAGRKGQALFWMRVLLLPSPLTVPSGPYRHGALVV